MGDQFKCHLSARFDDDSKKDVRDSIRHRHGTSTPIRRDTRLCMPLVARRTFVSAAALLPTLLLAGSARATLMRGLTLRRLVSTSHHVLLVTSVDARCLAIQVAQRSAIVTETRLRIDDVLAQQSPTSSELVVRTLGGIVAGVGELVHGQAAFSHAQQSVVFLSRAEDGTLWVTGMAQGHYPVAASDHREPTLEASPHLPTLRDFEHSAVRNLVGQNLGRARAMIFQESSR